MATVHHNLLVGQSNVTLGNNENLLGDATRPTECFRFFGGTRVALADNTIARNMAYAIDRPGTLISTGTFGASGKSYVQLKQGTSTYTAAMNNLVSAVTQCTGAGDTLKVRTLNIVHGEADDSIGTDRATYLGYLEEWLADYDADCKTRTGQAEDVVGITWQMSLETGETPVALAQLDAQRTLANYWCTGPVYQYPNSPPHLDALGRVGAGDLFAKVINNVIFGAADWTPLQPDPGQASRSNLVVSVPTLGKVGALVLDTTTLSARPGWGFSYVDSHGTRAIASVAFSGATILITLDALPTGTNARILYGQTASIGGNVRDSDTTPSIYDASPVRNWLSIFDEPVTDLTPPPPLTVPQLAKISIDGGPAVLSRFVV